jgi:hypothetical protein
LTAKVDCDKLAGPALNANASAMQALVCKKGSLVLQLNLVLGNLGSQAVLLLESQTEIVLERLGKPDRPLLRALRFQTSHPDQRSGAHAGVQLFSRKCFPKLLGCLVTRKPQYASTIMGDHKKAVENIKRKRLNRKETLEAITSRGLLTNAFDWLLGLTLHPARDCSLRQIKSEFQ